MQCPHCRGELAEGSATCVCGMVVDSARANPRDPLRARLQTAVEGEFALVRLLGRGGMGAVYLARELALDRLVGIKVLPPEAAEDDERRARFRREAQLAAKLSHPNIVPLHSFGDKAGLLYYVMGYVRGESLAERLRRDLRIPPEESRLMLAQLADALEYAHGKGVIHRDIKPDNILLDDETGRPQLADFGIARRSGDTGAGRIEGTPHYMAPEQAAGRTVPDGRVDVYSLGVVGYVMLSGQTPFTPASFAEVATAQVRSDPPSVLSRSPDVPPDLAAAVMRALARDPQQRWPTARSFKDALGATLDEEPERLPGELREMSSAVFYSVAAGWILGHLVLLLLPAVFAGWAALVAASLVGLSFAVTGAVHHRKGFSWAEMGRVSLWPPGWWPFWWPRAWRRPWDLWDRLPRAVRRFRAVYGLTFVALLAGVPPALLEQSKAPLLLLLGSVQAAVTILMLYTAWWAYRSGIPNNADLRSLILRATADRRFWKRPQLAQRLLPASAAAASRGSLPTPAEIVRQLSESTQRMTGRTRETAVRAVEVARLTWATIVEVDGALAGTDQSVEIEWREHLVARRRNLIACLQTLAEHHVRVLQDESAAALHQLDEVVRNLAAELHRGDAAGSSGEAPTLGATEVDLAR